MARTKRTRAYANHRHTQNAKSQQSEIKNTEPGQNMDVNMKLEPSLPEEAPVKRQRGRPRKNPVNPTTPTNMESFMPGPGVDKAIAAALLPPPTPELEVITPHPASQIAPRSGRKIEQTTMPENESKIGNEVGAVEEEGQHIIERIPDLSSTNPTDSRGRTRRYDEVPTTPTKKKKRGRPNEAKAPYVAAIYEPPNSKPREGMVAQGDSHSEAINIHTNTPMLNTPKSSLPQLSQTTPHSKHSKSSMIFNPTRSDANLPLPSIEIRPTSSPDGNSFQGSSILGSSGIIAEPEEDMNEPASSPNDNTSGKDYEPIPTQYIGKEKIIFDTILIPRLAGLMSQTGWFMTPTRETGDWGGDGLKYRLNVLHRNWGSFCTRMGKRSNSKAREYATSCQMRRDHLRLFTRLSFKLPSRPSDGVDAYGDFMQKNSADFESAISNIESSVVVLDKIERTQVDTYLPWLEIEPCQYIVPSLAAALHYTYRSGEVGGSHHVFDLYRVQLMYTIVGWLLRISSLLGRVLSRTLTVFGAEGEPAYHSMIAIREGIERVTGMEELVSDIQTLLRVRMSIIPEFSERRQRKIKERQRNIQEYTDQRDEDEARRIEEAQRRFEISVKQKISSSSGRPTSNLLDDSNAKRGGSAEAGFKRPLSSSSLRNEGMQKRDDIVSHVEDMDKPSKSRKIDHGHNFDNGGDGDGNKSNSQTNPEPSERDWEIVERHIRPLPYGKYDLNWLQVRTQKPESKVLEMIDVLVMGMRKICDEGGRKYPLWAKPNNDGLKKDNLR